MNDKPSPPHIKPNWPNWQFKISTTIFVLIAMVGAIRWVQWFISLLY